jgi:LPXTG-site transpeptidase (sortase) family protein
VHRVKAAVGGFGSLIAALAVVLALGACTGDVASTPTAEPSVAASEPDPGRAADDAVQLPDIPRTSAALADRPPVAAPAPVRLVAPDLGIDVPVETVGLDDLGRMGLPANPAIAAWYRFGPAPGSAEGSTVIAAHVDSLQYDIGPFARLADAAAGTRFEVTTADGLVHAYALESTAIVAKESVDWEAAFSRVGSPRLTLVTCGGEFDYAARRYLSNVLVTATPLG